MYSSIKIMFLLFLILVLPGLLFSQNIRINTGEQVRVKTTHSNKPLKGMVMDVLQSDLYVTSSEGEFLISQSEIRTLWVKRPKQRNTSSGFWIGGLSGSLLSGTIAALTWEACVSTSFLGCLGASSKGETIFQEAAGGFLVGGMMGAAIGYFTKTDRWVKIRGSDLMISSQITATSPKAPPALTFRITLIQS